MGNTTNGALSEYITQYTRVKYGESTVITSTDYTDYSENIINFELPPLPVKFSPVKVNNDNIKYNITIGSKPDKELKIIVKDENGVKSIVEGNNIPGILVNFNKVLDVIIVLSEKSERLKDCSYKLGDQYRLVFGGIGPDTQIKIYFTRINRVDKNDSCVNYLNSSNDLRNNKTTIPSINIDFQSLIDGSDIGNTVFTIIDKVNYHNHNTTPIIPNYTCKTIQINNPKTTVFNKACPLITNVLRGIGNTAYEKIVYLMENVVTNQSYVYDFALLLVKYSMLKYILSRLMYGDFNINYVLNKYDTKFLNDLSNTRFCKFVYDFINPNSNIFGFNKYFL